MSRDEAFVPVHETGSTGTGELPDYIKQKSYVSERAFDEGRFKETLKGQRASMEKSLQEIRRYADS